MKLELRGITKRFGAKTALSHVDLVFESGHIYGLLGRNGAGKSTLLNLVAGRLFPTEGEILLDGESAIENDRTAGKIFSMSETNFYPESLKVCQVFTLLAQLYPKFDRVAAETLSEKFELDTLAKNNRLSTGYQSIMKLICGLASNAPVLLLDEPVLGLDANNRELFYRILLEDFSASPRLIIFSTHLIEEAAKLVDRTVILKAGQIILTGETEDLCASAYSVSGPAGAVDAYAVGKNVLGTDTLGGLKTVYLREKPDGLRLPPGLEAGGISLQKLFIELTNR